MARLDLLAELANRVLVCDGAMGTQLMARGLSAGSCGEVWNVEQPGAVEDIHRAYADAGCDLITSNTFGGSGATLSRHGLAGQVKELNRAGAAVARRAIGDRGWVLGDVGPFGGFLEPMGDMTAEQLTRIFAQQAAALYDGGADAIIVETMSDAQELAVAVRAAKSISPKPVIATYAFERGDGATFRTMMGTTTQEAISAAIDAGADIVGANCGTSLGLPDYIKLAQALVAAAGKTPVILQPNAGSPRSIDGKLIYPAKPADMAELAATLKQIGVRVIGGCCGTTPEHLAAMSRRVRG